MKKYNMKTNEEKEGKLIETGNIVGIRITTDEGGV